MIEQVLALCGLVALVLITRSLLLLRHEWVGVDTFYHLSEARAIRNGSTREFRQRFYVEEDYDYPPLLHFILSRLDCDRRVQFLGPIADTANAVLLIMLAWTLGAYSAAPLAILLYAFTPYLLEASSSASPRPLSNLFLSGCMLSLLGYLLYQNVSLLLVAVFLAGLVLLSHRLTSQSLLVVLVALAVAFQSWAPILVLLGGVCASIALGRDAYLRSLTAHLETLRMRARAGDDYGRHLIDPIQALFNFPLLILAPLILRVAVVSNQTGFVFVSVWAFSAIVLAILWPFGEGFRHLMNAWTPYVLLLGYWSLDSLVLQAILVLVTLSLSVIKLVRMSRNVTFIVPEKLRETGRYLDKHSRTNDLILCLPKEISYAILYFTKRGRVLAGSGGNPKGAEFNVTVLRRYERRNAYRALAEAYPVRWIVDLTDLDWKEGGVLRLKSGLIGLWERKKAESTGAPSGEPAAL